MGLMHWLTSRMFFPLAALSAVAMGLYGLWFVAIGPWNGPRLHLNLFLAWLPYAFALAAVAAHQRNSQRSGAFWPCVVLWLLFFPNAPYLLTDWLYLPHWQDELWYAIILLSTFSVCGLLLAAVSLHLVQTVVALRAGREAGAATCIAALALSGVGVYLGRFLRLNSWDLFTQPRDVLNEALAAFDAQPNHVGLVGFSLLFTLLLGGTYYAVVSLRRTDWSREEHGVWSGTHRRQRGRRDDRDAECDTDFRE